MTIYNFEQVWGHAEAPVACRTCGRVNKRRIRDYCTVNPYNRNEAGEVRSRSEVQVQAQERAMQEASRQVSAGRICRKCSPA
jgi:hypothetical protein